jgi:hypothetical protein
VHVLQNASLTVDATQQPTTIDGNVHGRRAAAAGIATKLGNHQPTFPEVCIVTGAVATSGEGYGTDDAGGVAPPLPNSGLSFGARAASVRSGQFECNNVPGIP